MASKVSVSYHSSSSDGEDEENDTEDTSDADGENSSGDDAEPVSEKSKQLEHGEKTHTSNKNGVFNVMTKILSKQTPEKGSVILSKADTDRQIAKKRKKSEAGDRKDDGSSDTDSDSEGRNSSNKKRQKWLWENMARNKPSVLDKEKERNLQKVATRGVVQLFNAVRKQQRIVETKLEEVGPSVRKRDKVIQTMTKGKFLDILKGTPVSNLKNEPVQKELKQEPSDVTVKDENSDPTWNILRDDFMLGAEMKDWDKAANEDLNQNQAKDSGALQDNV